MNIQPEMTSFAMLVVIVMSESRVILIGNPKWSTNCVNENV
jgi:hypothetical protein